VENNTDPLFMKVVSPPAGSGQSAVFSYLYFHNDALGTPHALTDKAGQIVWSDNDDEFGAAQIASTGGTSFTSSTVCNLRFPGQYFDAETGLHYNFHRYYDPALGRYITEDPIREGLNWYAYAGSNPGDNVDPEGLEKGDWLDYRTYDYLNPLDTTLHRAQDWDASITATADGLNIANTTGIGDWWDNTTLGNWVLRETGVGLGANYGKMGYYDECDEYNQWSKFGGMVAQETMLTAIGGQFANKTTGLEINFQYYKNAKGIGMNILQRGQRRFAIDWHRFKSAGIWVNKIHRHTGATKSQMAKHRGLFSGRVL